VWGDTLTRPSRRDMALATSSSSWPAELTKGFPQHCATNTNPPAEQQSPASRSPRHGPGRGEQSTLGEAHTFRSGAKASEQPRAVTSTAVPTPPAWPREEDSMLHGCHLQQGRRRSTPSRAAASAYQIPARATMDSTTATGHHRRALAGTN
jgi:hypothetical protein